MQHIYDEDSGRSSCSVGSVGFNLDIVETEKLHNQVKKKHHMKTQEASTNTDLKVSVRPRSCVILSSPDERDPFPSCKVSKYKRKSMINLFNSPRMGGLTNAHSTLDIVSSTRINHDLNSPVAVSSLNAIDKVKMEYNTAKPVTCSNFNFKRSKPVQRAASRLYRAEGFKGENKGCVGPEFIVRASQPPKQINIVQSPTIDKRVVTVILLNGQRVEVTCDPNTVTAGQIFEAVVRNEKYEHSFMLGVAFLIGGDFVFLPEEYKLKKVALENWNIKQSAKKGKVTSEYIPLMVFLRIKFFLPTNISKNIHGGEWRHRVYLQLRRAIIEGQLTSNMQNLILLAGYALHIEFGEFFYREHGSGDYFLLEHYLPETLITNDMSDVKLRMKRAHETRRGLDKNKAIINYITLAQTFRDYGAHFYSSTWATRDGFCRDVWLALGPSGITIYSRSCPRSQEQTRDTYDCISNRTVLQSLPWHHIHTFYYNKKTLYIIPNLHSGLSKAGVKYKLKMTDGKSCFVFWLAFLHHKLYLKLYSKEDFINYLSDAFDNSIPNRSPQGQIDECSNYQDSYNLAVRNPIRQRRQVKKRFHVGLFSDKSNQNKENFKPSTEQLLKEILSPQSSERSIHNASNLSNANCSSNEGMSSSESCSLPRRHGVKMGTRVFNGINSSPHKYPSPSHYISSDHIQNSDVDFNTNPSDSDDLCSNSEQKNKHCNINSMKLLPERQYNHSLVDSPTAYVMESPKVYQDAFDFNLTNTESCLNGSFYQRLDRLGCVQGERVFVTAILKRDQTGALGLQVAEGSDGNVYIKSITPGGSAESSQKLGPGDQIISVNGQTLLNIKYEKALEILQMASQTVELIVLQNTTLNITNHMDHLQNMENTINGLVEGVDVDITDDELLNEEALKTIYTLIKLTKEKVVSRMKEKNHLMSPEKPALHKCLSENQVYSQSDTGQPLLKDAMSQKRDRQKFNTWRGELQIKPKRRPLSLSIPADVNLSKDCFHEKLKWDSIKKNTSIKSIQSSLTELDNDLNSTQRTVAIPRNFGLSRKWLGPVRYPVTPCKNNGACTEQKSAIEGEVVRKHFVYGAGNSDEDQIFL